MKKYKYDIIDLDCAACAKEVEEAINKINGIQNCIVNFGTGKITLESELENALEEIRKVVAKIEPDCTIKLPEEDKKESRDYGIIRLLIGIILAIIGLSKIIPNEILSNIFTVGAYAILLYRTFIKSIKQLRGKIIDENLLMVISCIGAYLVGEILEGLMVILLFEIGKVLEAKAISKSRKSIKDLMDIKPKYANLKGENGETKQVEPQEVKIGDTIIVKEGEEIPLDGIVISGNASLNTSALTGETKLYEVSKDSSVLSGSINQNGLIEIKVTTIYENGTVNRILELVEKATDKKAKTETYVSKLAKIYTPIVIILALIVAIFMPILVQGINYSESIYRALTFLVIACPCSIAISVPLSYFSGIGKASKKGILIKGSDFLDGLKDINNIIFDKTGTITTGVFEVSEINTLESELSEEDVLKYVALGENYSNHPLAKSIINKYSKEIDTSKVRNLKEISGKGIEYEIESKKIKIGNKKFIEGTSKDKIKEIKTTGTVIYLSIDNIAKGAIILEDKIKQNTKENIEKLKKLGITNRIFTGDTKETAEAIAKKSGIKEVKSQMLPQDKFEELEKIIKQNQKGKKVAFVGDGINDSPVLARADIGISMGGVGAQSAIEASDVVLMTDEISKIIEGIGISKKTNKIIKQNLLFSIGIKIIILALSILGLSNMWQAVFADVGVTIITILNTLRILK